MNKFIAAIISTIAFSTCGKSSYEETKPSPANKKDELPLSNPEPTKESLHYGGFMGCVVTIAPQNPENMETTKWNTVIGCSKVFEASSETELHEILTAESTSKCPKEVFSITVIGKDFYRCTLKPNKPLFFSSNQKNIAETYAYGGINCTKNISEITIPTLPVVSCTKQKLD